MTALPIAANPPVKRWSPRVPLFWAGLVAACVLAFLVGAATGSVNLPVSRTLKLLVHAATGLGTPDWPAWQETVMVWVRLPRVVVAALAGAGLALTGAVMQGVFRNPMAEPGIIGVTSGASFGAVVMLYSGLGAKFYLLTPMSAFAGALGCTFLVYALATSRGKGSVTTLLLAGIAIGGIAFSMTSFVLSLSVRKWEVGRQVLSWLLGDLEGRTWGHCALAAPLVLGGGVWLTFYARKLNVLMLGEEVAQSVGLDVPRFRRNLLILTSLVTGAVVSVAGAVGFVGLLAPHATRLLFGPDNRKVLPATMFCGAAFVMLADAFCRAGVVQEMRLGVVTSLCGGPFFLFLLLRNRNGATG